MATQLELQTRLEDILGSRNVYYQPPENIKMSYDAIVYSFKGINSTYANNAKYGNRKRYDVIFIAREPDSEVIDKLLELPYCTLGTPYTADNLHHYPFTLYF